MIPLFHILYSTSAVKTNRILLLLLLCRLERGVIFVAKKRQPRIHSFCFRSLSFRTRKLRPNVLCSIWLQPSRQYITTLLRIHPAASVFSHIINKHYQCYWEPVLHTASTHFFLTHDVYVRSCLRGVHLSDDMIIHQCCRM